MNTLRGNLEVKNDAYDSMVKWGNTPAAQKSSDLPGILRSAAFSFLQLHNLLRKIDAESLDLFTSPSLFAQPIIEWAKDRSKENQTLAAFALLRWYYPPARWTEILEAVRKLDPALANETDALLKPFIEEKVEEFPALIPEAAEASKDSQNQKFDDDLSLPPTR